MGTIAAGVLPVADVKKALALWPRRFLPKPLYVFFIVGGAMFALLTTLNASIGWMCRPIVQAAKDGWPRCLRQAQRQVRHSRERAALFYVIGLVPILAGLDISTSSSTVILTSAVKVISASPPSVAQGHAGAVEQVQIPCGQRSS